MRDAILESIFLDTALWSEAIAHGLDRHIANSCLEDFADPHFRADVCVEIAEGRYEIRPPHTGYRKKDDGGERMFLANEPQDRLLLNVIYKWLMRNEGGMIHPSCKSYQTGIGIGKIVKQISHLIKCQDNDKSGKVVGRKFDIHKYFDAIGREHIHKALDSVVAHHGDSSIIDLLRDYYDSDLYYDTRRHALVEGYQGIKQGCAVSSWLANVILYPVDHEVSSHEGLYVRYSDDIIYIGDDFEEVTEILRRRLSLFGLQLNERKISDIVSGEYFTFLGFEIHGSSITLSKKWVKHFQNEVDKRTVCNYPLIQKVRAVRKEGGAKQEAKLNRLVEGSMRSLSRFLLYGNGRFSWATEVLPTVNVEEDLMQLTAYCLDALRAVYTGHTNIGGLGKSPKCGIQRGSGRHVRSNRLATSHFLHGFLSFSAVQKAMRNKWLFRALAANMVNRRHHPLYGQSPDDGVAAKSRDEMISAIESLYEVYLHSQPNGVSVERFYARSLDEMSMDELIRGENRSESLSQLEQYLHQNVSFSVLQEDEKQWYWQSDAFSQLVLLKEWFRDS